MFGVVRSCGGELFVSWRQGGTRSVLLSPMKISFGEHRRRFLHHSTKDETNHNDENGFTSFALGNIPDYPKLHLPRKPFRTIALSGAPNDSNQSREG